MEGKEEQVGELGGAGARLGQGHWGGVPVGGGCVGTGVGTSTAGASAGQCSSSARAGLAAAALPLVVLASLRFGSAVHWEVQPALVFHHSPLVLH